MKNYLLLLISTLGFVLSVQAQQNIGIGTTTPHASSLLDLTSTTKGFLLPRMTGAQRAAIASPATGLQVYQTNVDIITLSSPGLYIYTGSSWKRMARAEEITGSSGWTVTGDHQYSNVAGNVGIGLSTNIVEKFTLKGDMLIQNTSSTDDAILKFQSQTGSSGGGGVIQFLEPDNTVGAAIAYSPTYNALSLWNNLNNDGVLRFYENGNVGINTSLILDAVSKLQIEQGDAVSYTANGYIQLGSPFGQNLVFGDDEILSRNAGVSSPLYIQQDGGLVKIGTGTGHIDTKLYITGGGESSLTTHGYMVLGSVTGGNMVLDPNEIQARLNGAATTLRLQQDGGALLIQGGALTVATNGNVGIGDLTPDEALHVQGNGLFDGTNPTIQLQNSGVNKGYFQLSGDNVRTGTNSGNAAGKYIFRINGTDRVFIDPSGNMGIGTASPLAKLDVAGRIRIAHSGEALGIDGSNPNIGFYHNGVYRSFISQTGSLLHVGVNNGKLRLDATQIAIGSVQSTADDFKLAVSGKIICEELKVELVANWPDYVFADDYKLTPLNELKSFIDTHQHLPDIPKAEDVQKNGFEVGEMNKMLLRKVEELTLYMIDQQEQIDALKALLQTGHHAPQN
jgi:hypothetical protein